MSIKKLNIIFLLLIGLSYLPATSQNKLSNQQREFIDILLPIITEANDEILQQRQDVYNIYDKFKVQQTLSAAEKKMIYDYLKFYRCDVSDKFADFSVLDWHFQALLKKIDIIPQQLALAQAAVESNWGKSRFAKQGNSFFGIRCKTKGCGIKPNNVKNESFYVKSYPSLSDCIHDYARLLNSSKYYEPFRELRVKDRKESESVNAYNVVHGLENYSSLRKKYIKTLLAIMKYNLQWLDQK